MKVIPTTNKTSATLNSVGRYLKKIADNIIADAKETYTKSRQLGKTNYELGIYHLYEQNISDAIMRFRMLLAFKSYQPEAWFNLGRCHIALEEYDQAQECFNKALSLRKDYPEVHFLMASLKGEKNIKEVPLSLIKEFYDIFAKDYDQLIVDHYHYQGDRLLYQSIAPYLLDHPTPKILDVGCGTGLCGHHFKEESPAALVDGVDIAQSMLTIASSKMVDGMPSFRHLICDDFHQFARTTSNKYDLVISGLSLAFQQNLKDSLVTLKSCIKKGGHLAVTLPLTVSKEPKDTFLFTCNAAEIQKALQDAGFHIDGCKKVTIMNGQDAIIGYATAKA